MDRTGRHSPYELCGLIWRSTMGFYSKSFRFEGGGRHIIGRVFWRWAIFGRSNSLTHDFVVGLNRTGKSCRLRWVNYLHPGLKRGKMTPQEERLVLELHAKWGNRWSKIARKLPGRTDNEIKNYWRTHMRKKAQEKKRAIASPPSSSFSISSPSSSTITTVDSLNCSAKTGKASFYDTGGHDVMPVAAAFSGKKCDHEQVHEEYETGYSMDDIWKDIELSEENCNFSCPSVASPSWDYGWDSLWKMDNIEEYTKMINLPSDLFIPAYEYGRASLTG